MQTIVKTLGDNRKRFFSLVTTESSYTPEFVKREDGMGVAPQVRCPPFHILRSVDLWIRGCVKSRVFCSAAARVSPLRLRPRLRVHTPFYPQIPPAQYTGFRLYGLRIYGLFGFISVIWSDFSTTFFGYMVISAIWSTLSGQNRGPYIRNPV